MRQIIQFLNARDGATALEFAIMGPVVLGVLFGLFDIAFSLYVKSSFTHAVNTAAREVYLDPDRTDSEIETDLTSQLAKFNSLVSTKISSDASGSLEYKVIRATMTYNYKTPILNQIPIILEGESRAPILNYSID